MLKGAKSVATFTIEDGAFAIVASKKDNGVQIIDVSDPSTPKAVGAAAKGDEFPSLAGPNGVDTFVSGDSTYALVVGKGGVQLIDVSVPSSPVGMKNAVDGQDGFHIRRFVIDYFTSQQSIAVGLPVFPTSLPPQPPTSVPVLYRS